jgi:hypothetical protein
MQCKWKGEKDMSSHRLKPKEREEILAWLTILKFPYLYEPNIKWAVNLETGKLIGLKSHDYHILMERILPVMFLDVSVPGYGRYWLNLVSFIDRYVQRKSQRI